MALDLSTAKGNARGGAIDVFDDITFHPGARAAFLDLLRAEYEPRLREGGLELQETWLLPPHDLADRESAVLLHWVYKDLSAFWNVRNTVNHDDFTQRFWAKAAPLIVSRTRRLGSQAGVFDDLPTPTTPLRPAARNTGVARHVLMLQAGDPARREALLARRDEIETRLESVPGVLANHFAPLHPFSYTADRVVWDIQATEGSGLDQAAILACLPDPSAVTVAEHLILGEVLGSGVRDPDLPGGFKRFILMRAHDDASAEKVALLERNMVSFSEGLEAIRNWRVSRVADNLGATGWTLCFEHEFANTDDFFGPYLRSPHHWAVVDRSAHPDATEHAFTEFWHGWYDVPTSVIAV